MAEELMVVLKRSENSGFGFSLLGTTGPPHVIYDIVENSPAAECGAVSLFLEIKSYTRFVILSKQQHKEICKNSHLKLRTF